MVACLAPRNSICPPGRNLIPRIATTQSQEPLLACLGAPQLPVTVSPIPRIEF